MKFQSPTERCHQAIDELLQRTILLGGKRLRPLLTYLVGDLFYVEMDLLPPFAAAIEKVHAASLSHDDVVDNASTRRGRPSINAVSSNKHAVLAGDYLLANTIVELTQYGPASIVCEMAQVINDLARGEWVQLEACLSRQYDNSVLQEISDLKTASIMSWCCVTPALLAELDGDVVELARRFGRDLGIAFQMMDDTLDFSGESLKDSMLDVENGQINYVTLRWLQAHPSLKKRYEKGEDIRQVLQSADMIPFCAKVAEEAEQYLERARKTLDEIEETLDAQEGRKFKKSAKVPLLSILDYLGQRKY